MTIETEDARETEKGLRARGVVISDPIQVYDEVHYVGSFLDSEGTSFGFAHTFEQSVPIQATLFQSQASSTVEGVWGATEQKTGLTRSPIRTLLSDKMLQDVTCLHKLPYFGD